MIIFPSVSLIQMRIPVALCIAQSCFLIDVIELLTRYALARYCDFISSASLYILVSALSSNHKFVTVGI